ncbi:putative immunoglobulin/major histocompatibility complex [Medicago truncatula]|uniref:Putative immunoglobulin/major histocompatibility complex n=1 Tax=Medicago truncatula TaxID=3880 RepID=A0A396IMR9_MEDTR|nr:putative immunoglobulin/major histocompatibility complex [Medicago truncatula]
MPLIQWTILMSSGCRTRDNETLRPFRTYASAPDGSWPANTRGYVTCQSGFLGSTSMSKLFPGLLQTLGLLRQGTWLWPSQSLLYMSSASRRGVIYFCRVSHPIMNPPASIPDYTVDAHHRHVPPYEEVLVEQQWVRHPPDPYKIFINMRARVESAMGHPDVFSNPEEVLLLMQGI